MKKKNYLKWYQYNLKRVILEIYGFKKELIKPIDRYIINKLNDVYCNNIPVSLLLTTPQICNGNCELFSMLLIQGLGKSNYQLVYATINDLALNPNYKEGNYTHCFIELKDINNKEWVYDTSTGLKYDKELYYLIENPVAYKILTKDTIKVNELYNLIINDKIDLGYSIEEIMNLNSKSKELNKR
ncbi:MAG: hypothetical protein IJ574_01585 [Bacilli bacterium]|nr:hypothetical protein [Bacilli bacterium]